MGFQYRALDGITFVPNLGVIGAGKLALAKEESDGEVLNRLCRRSRTIQLRLKLAGLIEIKIDMQKKIGSGRIAGVDFACFQGGFFCFIKIPLQPLGAA